MKEGTLVAVWKDGGEVFITTTCTEVYEVPAGEGIATKVVHLNGVRGYYALSHIRPITINNIHSSAIEPLDAAIMGDS